MPKEKSMREFSLIIPAYNEEKRIERVLESYLSYFKDMGNLKGDTNFKNNRNSGSNWNYKYDWNSSGNGNSYEIIIVCNGCVDKTIEIVKKVVDRSQGGQNILCIEFPQRLGKGGAVIEGFRVACGRYIGFVDCDRSTSPESMEKLFLSLKNSDCAGMIGSRWVRDSRVIIKQELWRRITSRIFNLFVRVLFGLPFADTQCGAKVFARDALGDVLPDIKSKGFEFDVELLWDMKRKNYEIREFPIEWQHEAESTFSLRHAPGMFVNLLKRRIGR